MRTINSLNLYINSNIWISKIEGKILHYCVEFSHIWFYSKTPL